MSNVATDRLARHYAVRAPRGVRAAVSLWRRDGQCRAAGVRSGRARRSKARACSLGASAELMVPKWFDKRPHLAIGRHRERTAGVARHRERALSARNRASFRPLRSACGLHQRADGRPAPMTDIPPLAASFGPAEIDKACARRTAAWSRCMDFFDSMTATCCWSLRARLAPDLGADDIADLLGRPSPA